MKILFPIRIFYPSQTGGPANSVYFLAKELVKKGVEVFVLTSTMGINVKKIKINQWTLLDGIHIYYSDQFFMNFIPKNILTIDIPQVDLIHLNSFFCPINLYFLGLAKKRRIPFIISPRGELLDVTFNIKRFKKRFFLLNPIVKYLYQNAILHVTSDEEENFVTGIYKKYFKQQISRKNRIFNVSNMIDSDLFDRVCQKYPESKDRYILYLGRISRKKNIELLIDVYAQLNIDKEVKLFIIGNMLEDKKYGVELENKVLNKNLSEKIIFSKHSIEGEAKERLYAQAELFVLPTRSENFGMVILEALAHGIPVVTTNRTPWKSLEEYGCGYWVNMEFNQIKLAIEDYFSLNKKRQLEMKKNAKLLAHEFLSENLVEKYISAYKNILS